MSATTTVYVAGHMQRRGECQRFIDRLRTAGVNVGHDWTRAENPRRRELAAANLAGVLRSDALVLMPHKWMVGAYMETGAALALGLHVFVIDPQNHSVFYDLHQVVICEDEDEAIANVLALTATRGQSQEGNATGTHGAKPSKPNPPVPQSTPKGSES